MAQYKREIAKWIFILLDKITLEQAFRDGESGLDAQDVYVLARFEEPLSIDGFLRSMAMDRKSSQRLLKLFLDGRYLIKRKDPEDARRTQLWLSERGRELKERIVRTIDEHIDLILKDLSVNEEIAVLKFISKINQFTVEKYEIK